jgi:hypothetical protein
VSNHELSALRELEAVRGKVQLSPLGLGH